MISPHDITADCAFKVKKGSVSEKLSLSLSGAEEDLMRLTPTPPHFQTSDSSAPPAALFLLAEQIWCKVWAVFLFL